MFNIKFSTAKTKRSFKCFEITQIRSFNVDLFLVTGSSLLMIHRCVTPLYGLYLVHPAQFTTTPFDLH